MKPVVQEEKTGCAIACSATIAGVSYKEARKIANSIGIYAEDSALWSKTDFIRKLLEEYGIKTGKKGNPIYKLGILTELCTTFNQVAFRAS